MALRSMTGFARTSGVSAPFLWAWEIKSVNAKGLDLRVRVPSGFDAIEPDVRARLGKALGRGACYATLTTQQDAATPEIRLNRQALQGLLDALADLRRPAEIGQATLDGLLAVRGVVDIVDRSHDPERMTVAASAMLRGLDAAIAALIEMRQSEGAALALVLGQRIDRIASLVAAAEVAPGRHPDAVRARMERAIAQIVQSGPGLDPARLHQEALLTAARADIREELDRLVTHVAAARELLAQDQPVGRRLDFLAQEFGREANTLCAKSNDAELTAIGMDLRVEIEQFREQVQNIE